MSTEHRWKSYNFVMLVLILQAIVYFVVYANVPIVRAVICFLYLMFIPGIAILKLLDLKSLGTEEKTLFSLALSIAFLMFIGLIINEIGRLATFNPLSLSLLLLSINTTVLLLSLIDTRHNVSILPNLPQLKRSEWMFFILLIVSLFALGSCGSAAVIVSSNNNLLLLLIVAILITISSVFVFEKTPSGFYSLILLVVSFCMIFFANDTIITGYIGKIGDAPIEFYAFRLTETKGFWDSALTSSFYSWSLFPTYSMLSVTILPLVLSTIIELDGSLIFKLLYPFIVTFLAFGAYKLYQTQTEDKEAFIAAFFFFTISIGKGWGSYKQQIAQLFYISLFLLLLKKDIPASKRNILFIIFAASLVISHYALAYIFLIIISSTYIICALMRYRRIEGFSIYQTKISLTLVLIFFTTIFSFYIFFNSSAAFNLLCYELNTVVSNLGQFFNIESRGTALQGLGIVQTLTIYNEISSILFIFTEFLLVLGFIRLITSKEKIRYNVEYKVIATLNMAIIAINLLLPKIADTFLMERFYQTTLIILAPLAVFGGKTIIELVPKLNFRKLYAPLLLFMVFIPLFLFQTGFVYEIVKVQSWSPLSMYRWSDIELNNYIVKSQEAASAQWLPEHVNIINIFIYSDRISQFSVLTSYGMMERGRVYPLSNTTRPTLNELIYIANINLINYIFNVSEVPPILEYQNKIYSNGECEIYKGYNLTRW